MKKNEIEVGGTYLAKVTNKVVPVRIDAENPQGDWTVTNLAMQKIIRIKSAQRLRGPAHRGSVPDEKPAKGTKTAEPKAKAMSALEAAAKVLADSKQPMNVKEMNVKELIEAMARKGYWASPAGKTPHATLYAAILREINNKGRDARFKKTDRGQFTLNQEG